MVGRLNKPRAALQDKLIGQRLKSRHLDLKMTQAEVAKALKPAVSLQQIQKYETGVNRLSSARAVQLSKILQVHVETLLAVDGLGTGYSQVDATAFKLAAELNGLKPKMREALLKFARSQANRGYARRKKNS
jgi:transcriptional regulator with XRE-family HTH domain